MTTRHFNLLSLPKKYNSAYRRHSGLGIDRPVSSNTVYLFVADVKVLASSHRQSYSQFVDTSSTVKHH